MNDQQLKQAEMIALRSIGKNPAAGNQWHETERKIKTVKPMNWKRTLFFLLLILAGLVADAWLVSYVFGG